VVVNWPKVAPQDPPPEGGKKKEKRKKKKLVTKAATEQLGADHSTIMKVAFESQNPTPVNTHCIHRGCSRRRAAAAAVVVSLVPPPSMQTSVRSWVATRGVIIEQGLSSRSTIEY
jgi:hypothetical protein